MRLIALFALCAACGARSELSIGQADASAPEPAVPSACKDDVQIGALMPVARFCSDRSRRSPEPAPLAPHVVWEKPVLVEASGLVVDSSARAIVLGSGEHSVETAVAVGPSGNISWTATLAPIQLGASPFSPVLVPEGLAVGEYAADSMSLPDELGRRTLLSAAGVVLSSHPWPGTMGDSVVSPSGATFVEVSQWASLGTAFEGIARVDPDGATLWEDRGACEQGSDLPDPYAFALRGTNVLLVCDGREDENVIHIHEVDESDTLRFDATLDGGLASDVVVAPNGHAMFLAAIGAPASLALVDIAEDGNIRTDALGSAPYDLELIAKAGIASDGTFVSFDSNGLMAIRGGAVGWRTPMSGSPYDLVIDSAGTVITTSGDSVVAFDLATGATRWTVPSPGAFEIAPAGPGKLYVLSLGSLTLLAD